MEKESLTDSVVRGGVWVGLSKFLERAGTAVFIVILARILFPVDFGVYSLVISIASIFMLFADLGIDSVMVRYLSLDLKNKEKTSAYFQYILKLKFLMSFSVSFILLAVAYPISFWIYKKPELFLPLIMSSLLILTSLFVNFLSSYFYVIKKFKYFGVKEILFQVIRILMVLFVFVLVASTYYLVGIIFGLILTNLMMIVLLFFWLSRISPYIFKKSKEKIDKKRILKFLWYVTIANVSGVFHTHLDILILGFFVSFVYIAYYKVAFSLVYGISGIFSYLNLILLPIFTSLRKERLETAFNKVLRFVLIFTIPSTFGILAVGKYLLRVLYGNDYLLSAYPLYILSFLLIAYIPIIIIATLLYSKEKPQYATKTVLISLLINFVLNLILISSLIKVSELLAIAGAGFAALFSKYFAFFYYAKIIREKLNVKVRKIFFIKPIIASLVMLLILVLINNMFKNITFLFVIGEIFLGIVIYFFIMVLIKGIEKGDIEIIKRIWKRK